MEVIIIKNMTDKLKEIINRELFKLPKENQEAITSLGWENIAEEIGKKYLISENEMNDFLVETLLVLAGLQDFDAYQRHVEDNVGTSHAEAEKITNEAIEKIFMPIADKIERKIKTRVENMNPTWHQNVDFILSGGNYAAFLEKPQEDFGDGPPVNRKVSEEESL